MKNTATTETTVTTKRTIGQTCNAPAIAWRSWGPRRTFYVESLPGQGGKDWGYTENPTCAMPLSPYWQTRFRANVRDYSTDSVRFLEVR